MENLLSLRLRRSDVWTCSGTFVHSYLIWATKGWHHMSRRALKWLWHVSCLSSGFAHPTPKNPKLWAPPPEDVTFGGNVRGIWKKLRSWNLLTRIRIYDPPAAGSLRTFWNFEEICEKYEEIMKKMKDTWRNMKQYEGNMKAIWRKYEEIYGNKWKICRK